MFVEELCLKMPVGSIETMASDTQECLEKMYQQYLDSNLYTADFNFEQEILKQIIPVFCQLKKIKAKQYIIWYTIKPKKKRF